MNTKAIPCILRPLCIMLTLLLAMPHMQVYAQTTSARQIAITRASYDGAAYTPIDSLYQNFSGGRGQNPSTGWDIDTCWTWKHSAGVYTPYYMKVLTYNSVNSILTDRVSYWRNGAFVDSFIYTNVYDAANNIISVTLQLWDVPTSSWINHRRNTSTYDGANNRISQTYALWNTGTNAWNNTIQNLNIYDGANNLLSITQKSWDGATSSWKNDGLQTYTYDGSNNRLTETRRLWNSGTATWDIANRSTYTYNSAKKPLTSLYESWSAGALVNVFMYFYRYDAANNKLADSSLTWSSATSLWRNTSRSLYWYDANNNDTASENITWNTTSNMWVNSSKAVQTYDANKNNLGIILMQWNTTSNTWVNTRRTRRTYNSDNNPLLIITDSWNAATSAWEPKVPDLQYRFYYEIPSMVGHLQHTAGSVSVYPSPAHNILTVDVQWDAAQQGIAAIYDLQGRLWQQWGISKGSQYHADIEVSDLPAGNYVLLIKGEKGTINQKFSIAR